MLPSLSSRQAFIEITHPVHGGEGWEIGRRLWSPIYNSSNQKTWQIMENIMPGDIILHFVKIKGGYHFTGISMAESTVKQTSDIPPKPSRWKTPPYQFVELTNFYELTSKVSIKTFLDKYQSTLISSDLEDDDSRFYVFHSEKHGFRVGQRYLARCSSRLYQLFSNFLEELGEAEIELEAPEIEVISSDSPQLPGRYSITSLRIIRDNRLIRDLKREYQGRCQICNSSILLPNGNYYSEGHHIKPLGGEHKGLDIRQNVIIVCPNHHAEFDFGSIAIEPSTLRVKHIDRNNRYHNSALAYSRPEIDKTFLEYHYTIFIGKKKLSK